MPTTQNIQATVNWALPFLRYQPVTIDGMEPALTAANLVLQTMLGPPFCWRWNRAEANFTCVPAPGALQDYGITAPDFGFIERAWLAKAAGTDAKEIQIKLSAARSVETGRPAYLSPQGEDGAGAITLRLDKLPDQNYTGTVLYQKKPRLLTSLACLWRPVPDEYGYIYQWGFLAVVAILNNDGRFPIFNQRFTAHLLGAQDGLDETQRNLFLGNWLELVKGLERAQQKVQQGGAARQQ